MSVEILSETADAATRRRSVRLRWLAVAAFCVIAGVLTVMWLRTRAARAGLYDLAAAVNTLPHRPITGRVSLPLAYKPAPAPMRGPAARQNWTLMAAVAALQERTRDDHSSARLHDLGLGALLAGWSDEAATRLEEALLRETGERDVQDAIHASTNAALLSDLAAAQYELGDEPDAHPAVEAVQRAWTLARTPAIAWNRALAIERMHVTELTAAAWKDYLELDGSSEWAVEARERVTALESETRFEAWKRVRQTLARQHDEQAIAATVRRFVQYARVHVEDDLLPEWGRAELRGGQNDAAGRLRLAASVADALRAHSGDTTVSDTVAAITAVRGARRRALAEAHAAFGEGRRLSRAQEVAPAARQFAAVESLARSAGATPLADHAAYQLAVCLFLQNDYAAGVRLVARVQDSLGRSPSRLSLNARVAYLRGLLMIQMGDPDGALTEYRRAIGLYERAQEDDSVALMSGRIADALDHVGETDEASRVRMAALAVLDRMGEPARRDPILFDAADVALSRGWIATAQLLFAPIADAAGQEPMWRCAALLARSSAFAAAERHQDAIRDYTHAREACENVPDADIRQRVLASAPILMTEAAGQRAQDIAASIDFFQRTRNRIWLPEMYRRLGRIHEAEGRTEKAEAAYREGIAAARQIAGMVTKPLERDSFQRHVNALFSSLVAILVERRAFHDALQYVEQGRRHGLEPVVVERDVLAGSRLLRDDVAVVDLKWTGRSVTAWVVTSGRLTPVSTRLDGDSLAALVARCRGNPECGESERGRLYDVLVRPWIEQVRRCCATVIFVVDADLESLPFAAFLDTRTGQPLVSQLAVATAPSVEAVFRSAAAYAERLGQPERVVLIGPPAHDKARHPSLVPLKGAEKEVRFLHRLYKGSEVVMGREATKRRFFAAAHDATLLQYSGHAIAVDGAYGSSALVLAPENTAPADDLLSVREVYAAQFSRLRVAVLAACNTAGRNAKAKTGSASVARGFLTGGVPVVIGTLWPVDDAVANAFTREFHRRLHAGATPQTALRESQLELMGNSASMFHKQASWAAFTACGAGGLAKGREKDDA